MISQTDTTMRAPIDKTRFALDALHAGKRRTRRTEQVLIVAIILVLHLLEFFGVLTF